jgi:hypothetical protein
MQHFDTWEGRAKPATTRLLEEGGKQGQELKNTGSYRRLVMKWKAGEEETVGNSRKETNQKTKSNVRMCHSDYDRDLNRKVNHMKFPFGKKLYAVPMTRQSLVIIQCLIVRWLANS